MPFERGVSGNKNGRPAGTPNKLTICHREFIQGVIERQGGKIERELKKLEGRDYIQAVTNLLEFVLPKIRRMEIQPDRPQGGKIVVVEYGSREKFVVESVEGPDR